MITSFSNSRIPVAIVNWIPWSLAKDSSQSRPFLAWSFPAANFSSSQVRNYIPYFNPHKLPIPPNHLWPSGHLHPVLQGEMQPQKPMALGLLATCSSGDSWSTWFLGLQDTSESKLPQEAAALSLPSHRSSAKLLMWTLSYPSPTVWCKTPFPAPLCSAAPWLLLSSYSHC